MKRRSMKFFCVTIMLISVVVAFGGPGLPRQASRGRYSDRSPASESFFAREQGTRTVSYRAPAGDHAWLLRPEVFGNLSSAGKRAVLRMNGFDEPAGGGGPKIKSNDLSEQLAP